MQGLLHWLLASSLRSGAVAGALAASRVFDIFGAGLLALVTLRKGFASALQVMAVAAPLLLIAGYFSGFGMALVIAILGLWIPVLLLSLVLRNTGSLAMTLQAGAGLAGVVLAGWFLLDAEPLGTVRAFLDSQVLPLLAQMDSKTALSDEQHDALVRIAPGLMAAASLVVTMLAVMAGRWWQAIAFNPGGFREDFHRLRQGRSATLLVAVLMFAALFTGQPVLMGFALGGAVTLIFQGIALAHGVVAATGQPGIWLWGMYGLVLLLPIPAAALLTIAGGVDNWMDFRRLAGQGAVKPNE
ncbi:MAG TPA: hypothetical protein VF275_05855 [Gammaproteobacteria bacterium]